MHLETRAYLDQHVRFNEFVSQMATRLVAAAATELAKLRESYDRIPDSDKRLVHEPAMWAGSPGDG